MSLTQFPEPSSLNILEIGNSKDMRNMDSIHHVGNPHPGYMKDPNILNEMGHTIYPKMVYPNGKEHPGVIVNSPAEEEKLMQQPAGNQLVEKLDDDIAALEAKIAKMKETKERLEVTAKTPEVVKQQAW